ncbi:Carboxymuconolactone decarboxylase [Methanothermus fervidus DSM 2088]|uniref:Carboxymuconolactone decarboxylase n=1 Tax=Methanothermus fervidus (strain ATCC 43054 / DSM 2088 / JCM 10308 / V24 S) TaxID=523846 RepID=E3GZ83_METFV|nr:carboxymuconolactone decarboxylase family protein [Methanothermus fervidus]ADP77615.1 Carboxymuconolactone decarboxylase [Methanothermus fervidus DSM 2088]
MKEEVFYAKGVKYIKEEYPEIYESLVKLNEAVYTGKVLDYKTQKLIALGITAAKSDDRAIRQQIKSAIEEFGVTKDEIMDVLRVVLLTSGNPPFMKAVKILHEVLEE